eukprot:98575_1
MGVTFNIFTDFNAFNCCFAIFKLFSFPLKRNIPSKFKPPEDINIAFKPSKPDGIPYEYDDNLTINLDFTVMECSYDGFHDNYGPIFGIGGDNKMMRNNEDSMNNDDDKYYLT